MTQIPILQIDAFAERPFEGNPAAVCPLENWLETAEMQAIAAENNLSETAFVLPAPEPGAPRPLRWFTPTVEVPLCGHATLATAHAVFFHGRTMSEQCPNGGDSCPNSVSFMSESGVLTVSREQVADGPDLLVMDLPAAPPEPVAAPEGLAEALDAGPIETHQAGKLLGLFDTAEQVAALTPDFPSLKRLAEEQGFDGVIATAPGTGEHAGLDFVSRYFAPHAGIDEDPVTGSAHCKLTPFWAKRLGKETLRARQISARGGNVICVDAGGRTVLKGRCVTVLEGVLRV